MVNSRKALYCQRMADKHISSQESHYIRENIVTVINGKALKILYALEFTAWIINVPHGAVNMPTK